MAGEGAGECSPAEVAVHSFHAVVLAARERAQLVEGHSWRERDVTRSADTTRTQSCQDQRVPSGGEPGGRTAGSRVTSSGPCRVSRGSPIADSLPISLVLPGPAYQGFQPPGGVTPSPVAVALAGAMVRHRALSSTPARFLTSELSCLRANNPHLSL